MACLCVSLVPMVLCLSLSSVKSFVIIHVVMDVFALMDVEQVYLGEQYVNSSTLSDVTFLVEGVILCTALLLNSYQYSLMVAKVA